ncbi:MAG: S4 domain-containing protein, partial [Elioraea tepidiphila]
MKRAGTGTGERIAKWLAHAGIASRRDAEKMIAEGRVAVNGRRLTDPAVLVEPGDAVTVDKVPV